MTEHRIMHLPPISKLAVPGVVLLISFLSFTSQLLFLSIEPGPLKEQQTLTFNILIGCLLVCYTRACLTNPGHLPKESTLGDNKQKLGEPDSDGSRARLRYCTKCEAPKPPRAHHCKICKRCIPKMDHHCPWTVNCVSHTTFPHFIRFVFYSVAAMSYLEYFLYIRVAIVWNTRALPSYLGPTPLQLIHLFTLMVVNSFTLFALSILLARSIWCLAVNTTTIEGWEIERHEAVLRRSRYLGGYLDGPDGMRVKIVRQEFPYDIGIWSNIKQGMGTRNVFAWLWPFAASPSVESGLRFEVNGFEDPDTTWPPPDPDRMPRVRRRFDPDTAFVHGDTEVEAFRQRQAEDLKRYTQPQGTIHRRLPFHKRFSDPNTVSEYGVEDVGEEDFSDGINEVEEEEEEEGEEAWRNSEGERLGDFGVDEDVEFYDEDDIPLAELIRRRKSARIADVARKAQ
ncbi:putative zinc finger protein DHHC domain-containing protein [Cryomyces antarcticus]